MISKYLKNKSNWRIFSIPLDPETKARIEALSDSGVKVSAWARDVILKELPRLEKEAKDG